MNEIAPLKRQSIQVIDPIPVLDTGRFEQMQRIARVMAESSLIPDSLCKTKDDDGKDVWLDLPRVIANCFLVVNQAVRWGMDPFAVAQCVSVVHGRICYEGKLVAAVLDAKIGVNLNFRWDDKTGDLHGIVVFGTLPGEVEPREVDGTVGGWKTTSKGSPWLTTQGAHRQLAYRGAREWARLHKPSIMLGVYTDDEMIDLAKDSRTSRFRDEPTAIPTPPTPPKLADASAVVLPADAGPTPSPSTGGKKDSAPIADGPNRAERGEFADKNGVEIPLGALTDFDAFHKALDSCPTLDALNAMFEALTRNMAKPEDLDEAQERLREVASKFGMEEE
jgi:hypothetical protein